MSLLLDTLRQSAKNKAAEDEEIDNFTLDDSTLEELSEIEDKPHPSDAAIPSDDSIIETEGQTAQCIDTVNNSEKLETKKTIATKPDTTPEVEKITRKQEVATKEIETTPKKTANEASNNTNSTTPNTEQAKVNETPKSTAVFSSSALKKQKKKQRKSTSNFTAYTKYALIFIPILIAIGVYIYSSSTSNTSIIESNYSPEDDMSIAENVKKHRKTPSNNNSEDVAVKKTIDNKTTITTENKNNSQETTANKKVSPSAISGNITAKQKNTVADKKTSTATTALSIKKSKKTSALTLALNNAYAALMAGELNKAQTLYEYIITKHPKHIHALLALAKIHNDKKDTAKAKGFYERILHIDNSHAMAQIGLLHANPYAQNTVDALSQRFPENANIAAAKGAFYAQKGDWRTAQQAYFDAYSLQPNNAEFTFNLAVALDNLNKYKTAKTYYKSAIALTQSTERQTGNHTSSTLDIREIQTRIAQLERIDER